MMKALLTIMLLSMFLCGCRANEFNDMRNLDINETSAFTFQTRSKILGDSPYEYYLIKRISRKEFKEITKQELK